MKKIEIDLNSAVARMKGPRIKKIFSPGIHKFLVRFYERARNKGALKKVKLFFGGEMMVVLPEVVSETLHSYGLFDETVTWLVAQSVKEGDTVLDLGAHFGFFSLLCSHLVGRDGKVISFEPTPSTYGILKINCESRSNIEPLNFAVGDIAGECEITDYGLKYCAWNTLSQQSRMPNILDSHGSQKKTIKVVKLDDYLSVRNIHPDFIKIDTEDFEWQVVNGLSETIRKYQPKVVLEAGGSDGALKAGNFLTGLGYQVFVSEGHGSLKQWQGEFASANKQYSNILFVPG